MIRRPVDAETALALWARYPVTAVPRPLVFAGTTGHITGGFDSGAAKIAFLEGAVDPAAPVPPGVMDAMCPPDVPARRRAGNSRSDMRLQVTAALSVTAQFRTDRGDRELPAWELTVTHLAGTVTVLDPQIAAEAWFPPGLDPEIGVEPRSSAVLHDDGRTLTLTFAGIPHAYADYPSATVLESDTAVVIEPVTVDLIPETAARYAYAETRRVTISLSRPLGARVLITHLGHPIAVSVPAAV